MTTEDTFNVYYLDDNNVIVDVSVFALDASKELLNDVFEVKKEINLSIEKMISSIDYGRAGIGWDLYKGYLRTYSVYPSWTWNDELKDWQPPVACPGPLSDYYWNESTLEWIKEDSQNLA
jgi:hypothetical protein